MGILDGKIALVTGASKGLGKAIGETFAREGATVVLTARSAAELDEVAAAIEAAGGTALALPGDITSEAHVDALFARIEADYGRLDILVNNAGTAVGGPVEEAPLDKLRWVLELNVVAAFNCLQHAVNLMKKTGTPGKVINIGSVRSRWTEGGSAGFYNASKYAIYGMTESCARQLQGDGSDIAVCIVNPGVTDTPLTNPNGEPRPQWLVAQDIADAVLHAAAAPPKVNVYEMVVMSTTQKPW